MQTAREFVRRWRIESPDAPYDVEAARQAVSQACREIHRLGRTVRTCRGMATTLTLLLVDGRRAVGLRRRVEVDTLETRVVAGDRIVLCTDGLNLALPAAPRSGVLEGDDLEEVLDALVREAGATGGHDNATVVVVDPASAGPGPPWEDDEFVCTHWAAPWL